MYPLKRNCNFQTETPFCASKSPKFPCILSCKTVFISNKHNNDCKDEQTLIINKKNIENVTSVLNSAPATPPYSTVDATVTLIRASSQSPANNVFLVFCSVDGWQTTILEGLGHLWHTLFTHFKLSIYLKVNKMSRNGKKTEFTKCETENSFFF